MKYKQQQQPNNNDDIPNGPIQRLLILHFHLAKLCTGQELSERASEDEWNQEILYYYQQSLPDEEGGTNNKTDQNISEAVRFAGLCSALYSLPHTIQSYKSNSNSDDSGSHNSNGKLGPTQEVHLERSTLVFVPLEKCPLDIDENQASIVAVAQLSRRSPREANGGNPQAMRTSLQKCHEFFCLLRGGGIGKRLSKNEIKQSEQHNSTCPYPGMDQFYEGKKTLRKLNDAIHRSSTEELDSDLEQERDNLIRELEAWEKILPVSSLRDDLKIHYDTYLGDFALMAGRNGGVGRCLVEMVPAPVAIPNGRHIWQWSPSFPPPHVSIHLGHTIRSLFQGEVTDDSESNNYILPRLRAVSTFYQGQLLYHHDGATDSMELTNSEEEDLKGEPCSNISDAASSQLLMWYLSSYSFKMKQQRQVQQTFEASTSPRRISRGLVSFSDHASANIRSQEEAHTKPKGQDSLTSRIHRGSFLKPPPLAMLSVSEQAVEIKGPKGEAVWAPVVHLASTTDKRSQSSREEAQVVFYEWKDYSFLLYLSPVSLNQHAGSTTSSSNLQQAEISDAKFLERIADALSNSLNLLMLPEANKNKALSPTISFESSNSLNDTLSAPGRDVIFMDRAASQVMVFPRIPAQSSTRQTNPLGSAKKFLGVFSPSPPPSKKTDKPKEAAQTRVACNPMDWAADGMDCRHWLASHLPLDSILALDDVMTEVQRRRHTIWMKNKAKLSSKHITPSQSNSFYLSEISSADISSADGSFEIFTSIPQGWLYAFADCQDRELYVLLDASVYVTVADVQKSAMHVRSELFRDITISESSFESSPMTRDS
mgnify:CR=1 FL=1